VLSERERESERVWQPQRRGEIMIWTGSEGSLKKASRPRRLWQSMARENSAGLEILMKLKISRLQSSWVSLSSPNAFQQYWFAMQTMTCKVIARVSDKEANGELFQKLIIDDYDKCFVMFVLYLLQCNAHSSLRLRLSVPLAKTYWREHLIVLLCNN